MPSQKSNVGRRLLPQVLDDIASSQPNRLYGSIARIADLNDGFRDITFHDMSNGVNWFAHYLEDTIGQSNNFETIGYVGVSDFRTAIIFLAAVKCGYKLFLPSPRNPLKTNLSLFEQTGCRKLFYSPELAPLVKALQASKGDLDCVEVPSFEDLVTRQTAHFPFNETFEEAALKPVLVLHSSGSTGNPKAITIVHGAFAAVDNEKNLPQVPGRKNHDFSLWDFPGGGRFFTVFPSFYLAGIACTVAYPIFSDAASPVLGPPLRPPTGSLVREVMDCQKLRGLYVPPTMIVQLLQEPNGLDYFKELSFVCFAGGPLPEKTGDAIREVTDVCQFYGSTEAFSTPQLMPQKENWSYMEWHPQAKIRMEPSEDESFELVLLNDPDPTAVGIAGAFYNFPHMQEWQTRDLFKPHPEKHNLWRFYGRLDDILVLSSGGKFHPVPLETLVSGQPLVAGALVTGHGDRHQAALMIEPAKPIQDEMSFIKSIWPIVERGNLLLPSHGRIIRSNILVANPDKPFVRTPKGTIVRKLTEKAYEAEIEALYSKSTNNQGKVPKLRPRFDFEDVIGYVKEVVNPCFPGHELGLDDDFYTHFLDSIRTVEIVKTLRAGLQQYANFTELQEISVKMIYTHPTIKELSQAITNILNPDCLPVNGKVSSSQEREMTIARLIQKYTSDFHQKEAQTVSREEKTSLNIALTGSTGYIGSHLLRLLSDDPRCTTVYCLDRAQSSRQTHGSRPNGQIPSSHSSKIKRYEIDVGKDELGLPDAAIQDLSENINIYVHNAWKVDFNQHVQSFEDHLRGTRALLDMCMKSPRHPRLVFMSSIASIGAWNSVKGAETLAPEAIVEDSSVTAAMGYAESKHVAERILSIATTATKCPVSIYRIGQVAGSTSPNDSAWPEREWVPSLIRTSKVMSLLPDDLPSVDWIPVDKLATIVSELIFSDVTSQGLQIYNVTNPRPVPWSSLLGPIKRYCGPETKIVSLAKWTEALHATDASSSDELSAKPALKMLDLFDGLVEQKSGLKCSVERSMEASNTMQTLKPVSEELMELWLRRWKF